MRKHVEESVATGAAAGRGRGGRFSAGRKREVVLRLLRGEDLESVSRAVGITAARASHWRAQFLAAGQAGLKNDGPPSDRQGRRRRLLPHGGRGLRHAWHLRGCGCAWRDGGHSTAQDGHRVWMATTIARARPHDPAGAAGRTATVEEGRGLPSAGPCGERLLPVQVDHWGEPSSAPSLGARD